MRRYRRICLVLLCILPLQAQAFGLTGHRVAARIAALHLTDSARTAVQAILGGDSLAKVSTWPDEMRSVDTRFWKVVSPPWHYVNIPRGKDYDSTDRDPRGDVLMAIRTFTTLLTGGMPRDAVMVNGLNEYFGDITDPARQAAVRRLALIFLVHLVADLHQPLHVGHAGDQGGNLIQVRWFGHPSNLHKVWDTELIDSTQLSFSEMARFIDTRDPALIRRYQAGTPRDWLDESLLLRKRIYKTGNRRYSYKYRDRNVPIVELQLLKAGLRTAKLLNDIFGP